MTIRRKTLLILISTLVTLAMVLFGSSQLILLRRFTQLEQKETVADVGRVLHAAAAKVSNLKLVASDWAYWDDTYTFVQDRDEHYIAANLGSDSLSNLDLNLMLLVDAAGQIVFAHVTGTDKRDEAAIPQPIQILLTSGSLLLQQATPTSSLSGFALLPEGTMAIVALPILTSDRAGPIAGTLIWGRYLNVDEIRQLTEQADMTLDVYAFTAANKPDDVQAVLPSLTDSDPIQTRPVNDRTIGGYALLPDVQGGLSLILKITIGRDLYVSGQTSIFYLLLSMLVIGFGITVATMLMLERVAFSRLAGLAASVRRVWVGGDHSNRVQVTGNDEVSDLGEAINEMLASLTESEKSLFKSEELLRTVMSNLPVVVTAFDLDGKFMLADGKGLKELNIHRDAIVGQSIYGLEDFPAFAAQFETALKERGLTNVMTWNGLTFDVRYSRLRDPAGEIRGVICIAMDITARKQLEDQLNEHRTHLEQVVEERTVQLRTAITALQDQVAIREQTEKRLRSITDNMLDMIWQTDLGGVIDYASPSCWATLGYAPEILQGMSAYESIHPEDVLRAHEQVESVGRVECRYRHANGQYLWLEILTSFTFGEDDEATRIIWASRDITARKQAETELEELNRLKTEFLSTAAHELRTPLTSIRGFGEILTTRELDPARQKRYIALISDQATQLGLIINDLLDISRMEAKRKLSLKLEETTLATLVEEVVTPFIETTPTHNIVVEDLEGWPTITGDSFRLAQLFKNLLSNAIKYSPKGGNIVLRGKPVKDYFEMSISDQGMGMSPEQQAHLFEKFYRADAVHSSINGTGLGLAIAKLIVELHGGQIWAESKVGVGTTFYFTLPLSAEQIPQQA